jgi:predicted nucleic acid-binding protein
MDKWLIDTNVFVYDLDADSMFNTDAHRILTSENSLFTTHKNITELFAVLSKIQVNYDIILNYYHDITKNIQILYPNEESLLHFESLANKHRVKGNRIYDLEVISIMLTHQINTVATFNTKDFEGIADLKVVSSGY